MCMPDIYVFYMTWQLLCRCVSIGLISIPISPPVVGSAVFVIPAGVNCVSYHVKIIWKNVPDEEHFHIMLNGDELRVVHPGFFGYLFVSRGDLYAHGIKTKRRLVFEQFRFDPFFDDDSVLFRLGPFLVTALPVVSQDWTARN